MNERTTRSILKIRGEEEGKGSSFNRIRWISREKGDIYFISFYLLHLRNFSLILDDSFVAGE